MQHGVEDPRVLESFDSTTEHSAVRINYLKNDGLYNYFKSSRTNNATWKRSSEVFYDSTKTTRGLTHKLSSPGNIQT